MENPLTPEQWVRVGIAVVGTITAGGTLAFLGRILDKLFPSALERLQDSAERRREIADRLTKLLEATELELKETREKWLAAEQRVIAAKGDALTMQARLSELAMIRDNMQPPLARGLTPQAIADLESQKADGETPNVPASAPANAPPPDLAVSSERPDRAGMPDHRAE